MYIVLWEFIIRGECVTEFETAYGPQGAWASLFAKSEGYRQTQLLRDTTHPRRYVTLDFWMTSQAHEKFRREHAEEYKALDERCARFTVEETRLGEFQSES